MTTEVVRYSIVIEWSDDDQRYVVILPEWAERYAMPVASGATYRKKARKPCHSWRG
jgi:predicted RNase H-like HicB family nuclease